MHVRANVLLYEFKDKKGITKHEALKMLGFSEKLDKPADDSHSDGHKSEKNSDEDNDDELVMGEDGNMHVPIPQAKAIVDEIWQEIVEDRM